VALTGGFHDSQVEIGPAIVVVIEKDSPPANRRVVNTGCGCYITKGAVALTLQQRHRTAVREIEIEITVTVIISRGQAHAHHLSVGTGFNRDIGKTPEITTRTIVAP